MRCDEIRTGFETAHMSRHSIADRRGWTGPPTIGDDELWQRRGWIGPPTVNDDELWITIIRRLRDADHRRLTLDAKDIRKAKRDARRAIFEDAAA